MAVSSITIRNDIAEIRQLAQWAGQFCDANGLRALENRLTLVLEELLTNVIAYGYDDDTAHRIDVRLTWDDGMLTAVFTDDGRPFDPHDVQHSAMMGSLEDRPVGGLGIHLILTTMDRVDYVRIDGRNRTTMTLAVKPPPP